MKKWSNPLWYNEKTYLKLAHGNCKAIKEHNEKMLSSLTLMGGLLMLLPLFTVPFSNAKKDAVPVYLIPSLIFLAVFFLYRLSIMKKYTLIGLYSIFSIFFLLAFFLSLIRSSDMRATILLGVFCIMPLGFIDRPVRMNMFVAFWFTAHMILAFYLKPKYAFDDTINSLCFAILGCFLGNIMIRVHLVSFEAYRRLTIEKGTDELTGLSNRRKLFETLAVLETKDSEKPSGIMMLDIDHFKDYNDNYGHAAGDRYLRRLGKEFLKFAQNLRLHFYRYGGEEFVAMAYGYGEKELLSIAENLRGAVESMDLNGNNTTISIGVAFCGDEQVRNYEKVIDRADKAAYAAKRTGRNKVCMEETELD
jgi:diguanylate cyclase (GGDEF)-like protein